MNSISRKKKSWFHFNGNQKKIKNWWGKIFYFQKDIKKLQILQKKQVVLHALVLEYVNERPALANLSEVLSTLFLNISPV